MVKTRGDKVIGLDMSLQNFYVDSLGNTPQYVRQYRKYESKLAFLQKSLSRKPKGSNNRRKQRVKVARLYEKIINYRKDFVEKQSLNLVQEYDVIVVENLSLQGMSQSLNLGKSVMDTGYSLFVKRLQDKAEELGKEIVLADKWFASSKTCHTCGYINKSLLLQEREWQCPMCNTNHNRDINAAKNLEAVGRTVLAC